MNIVFLYSELMPNLMPVFRSLIETYCAQIHVVYWDHRKKTPYTPEPLDGLTLYRRSEHGYREIRRVVADIRPNIIYVAGWMDRTYLPIVAQYRRKGVPVVVGFDDWWRGTPRQVLGRIISPVLRKVFFSHAWVSGPRQYEFAKRLGFDNNAILPNLLSCDTELFGRGCNALSSKRSQYPGVFLYVGRFSPEKGIDLLAAGFEKYRTSFSGNWELVCIGNGPLLSVLLDRPGIEIRDFTGQAELVEAMEESGAFVMPSLRDFSPLAVHEAACSALPMILSTNVGNIPLFMIHNYNGIVFDSGSVDGLAEAMHRMSSKAADELVVMGERSHELSRRVNPEVCAASFMSCVQREKA